MTVRSDVLAAGAPLSAANVFDVIATVPANERWIIKEVLLDNQHSASARIQLLVGPPGAEKQVISQDFTNTQQHMLNRWTVAREGSRLLLRCVQSPYVAWYFSGARLVL